MVDMKRVVGVLAVGVVFTVGACSSGSNDVSAVCVDPVSGVRVDDSRCGADDGFSGLNGFYWYYVASSLNRPATGVQVVNNTYYNSPSSNPYAGLKSPPSDKPVSKGIPSSGATAGASVGTKVNATLPKSSVPVQDKPNPNIKGSSGVNPAPKSSSGSKSGK